MMDNITEQSKEIFKGLMQLETVAEKDYSKSLKTHFNMDSLEMINLIVNLEESFDFEFEDEDLLFTSETSGAST